MQAAVLLHNIRSAHNTGSIFRTAEAAGVSKIFLSGYTPQPVDRFGNARKDVAKVALGAEKFLPWEYQKNPHGIVAALRKEGWRIVGVEQDERAIDYRKFKSNRPTLFIFGNEVRGISPALRNTCDELIEIPMRGKKESLNVSVAAGIVLFSLPLRLSAPASARNLDRYVIGDGIAVGIETRNRECRVGGDGHRRGRAGE